MPRIHERISDHLGKRIFTNVVRAAKRRENTIARQQFEGANVQLAITPYRVAQSALRLRERWWIENDQVILRVRFFGSAKESENILLDPFHFQMILRSVSSSGRDVR